MRIPADLLAEQLAAVFSAWGMPADHVDATTRVLMAAELRGIDSHGAALLPLYDQFQVAGKLTLNPVVNVVRESPVTALLDGGGGLGHFPSLQAMNLAVDKSASVGIGAVGVRNSNHFGAAGIYALMAAERGHIGFCTTAVWRPGVVPTFGVEPMLGTNPIAFAAPARHNPPFCLDMSTSTVALGKIKLAALRQKTIPGGWATGTSGQTLTDPREAMLQPCLTPLGGTAEMSSYKGYGLGAMVEILSTFLTGSAFAPTRGKQRPNADRYDVGHFFLAVDPRAFREEGAFEADLDDFIAALRGSKPADPSQPVAIPGDPELAHVADRTRHGIPLSPELLAVIAAIVQRCGAGDLLAAYR